MPYTDYSPRLLIVDDDPVARLMLKTASEEMALFHTVFDCESSSQALEILQQERVDLFLLDYELDDLTGLQVFEQAKHLQDPIAGILVTAHDEKEVIKAAIHAGIRDFLEKPIPSYILANALQRAWDELEIRILLDAERRNHQELLESLPDIVYKIDMDGYIEYINQTVEEFGFNADELIGKHISRVIAAEDYHAHSLQTTLDSISRGMNTDQPPKLVNERRSGVRRTRNLRIRLNNPLSSQELRYRDGELVSFGEITARGIFEGNVITGSLGLIRDITERERTERELQKSLAKQELIDEALRSAENGKNQFLADMSHEVRTPLNAIKGTLDLLAQTGLTDEQERQLELLRASSRALEFIVDDILDISRIDTHRFRLSPVNFSPDAILSDILSVARYLPEARDLEVKASGRQEKWPSLNGDAERIQQILLNLVHNAVKYTEQGRVEITMDCQPVDNKGYYRLTYSVYDTGVGINKDDLEYIFERRGPEDISRMRRYSGTGLGLPISRELARFMRGDIHVTSQPGEGSVFTFTVVLPEANMKPAQPAEPIRLPFSGPVLIVEDNMTNRMIINGLLKSMDIETDMARSGTEAILKAENRAYSVIFMDLQMPGMDGTEAARRIRDSKGPNASTFIVALTAEVVGDVDERCRRAGMDEYLPKPVGKNEIREILQKLEAKQPSGIA